MALISNDVRSATVQTLEPTECLQLDNESFDALLDKDLDLAQRIAKIMTRRFSTLVHKTSSELLGAYRALTFVLANITESRDPETGAHHEWWNGTGYPHGLAGENIPLEARIMALADVYDALLSRRVYKPAMAMREAADKIQHGAGVQFDPNMTLVMIANISRFEDVYLKYQDE